MKTDQLTKEQVKELVTKTKERHNQVSSSLEEFWGEIDLTVYDEEIER